MTGRKSNREWDGERDWPFQYQGMEKEFTDPETYYYAGGVTVLQTTTAPKLARRRIRRSKEAGP
jgi:hypothetical protein